MIQNKATPPVGLPEDILYSLPESVRSYIYFIESCLQQQKQQEALFLELERRLQDQAQKIHELEARLAKNSSNSSKPPGSDGLRKPIKPTSERGKSGKKPGGQKGRIGKTLEQVD